MPRHEVLVLAIDAASNVANLVADALAKRLREVEPSAFITFAAWRNHWDQEDDWRLAPWVEVQAIDEWLSKRERNERVVIVTGRFDEAASDRGDLQTEDLLRRLGVGHLFHAESSWSVNVIVCGPYAKGHDQDQIWNSGSTWYVPSLAGVHTAVSTITRRLVVPERDFDRPAAVPGSSPQVDAAMLSSRPAVRPRIEVLDRAVTTSTPADAAVSKDGSQDGPAGIRRFAKAAESLQGDEPRFARSEPSMSGIAGLQRYFRRLWGPSKRGRGLFGVAQGLGGRTRDAPFAQDLQCSVYAPTKAREGAEILIQAIFHPSEAEAEAWAARQASLVDPKAQTRGSLWFARPQTGEKLEVRVSGDGLVVEQPVATFVWRGRKMTLAFAARIVKRMGEDIVARVAVFCEGAPIGVCHFAIEVSNAATHAAAGETKLARYRKAFLSYSSADRTKVMHHYQLLHRIGLEVFQDVMTLAPGEAWKEALFRHIDEADLFLLYWSSAAAKSEWVLRESEQALRRQRSSREKWPDIVPILLEGPPPPPVPPSLAEIHMNDPLRYIIAAQEAADAMTHRLK